MYKNGYIFYSYLNRCNYTMYFKGDYKSYEICDSYTFEQNSFLIQILMICNVKVNVSPLKLTSLLLSSSKKKVTVFKTDLFIFLK